MKTVRHDINLVVNKDQIDLPGALRLLADQIEKEYYEGCNYIPYDELRCSEYEAVFHHPIEKEDEIDTRFGKVVVIDPGHDSDSIIVRMCEDTTATFKKDAFFKDFVI